MSTELIRPNWHVVIIHYPLALLTVGLVIEVFSFLWRRGSLRTAGWWMILLGAVFAIPAATTGLYAFRDVMAPGPTEPQVAWYRLVERSPWSDEQWRLMSRHVIFAGGGTVVIALSLLAWLAVSDATRRDVDLAAMTLAREAFRRARALLTANRECLDDLAETALVQETLTREELDQVFARHTLRGLVGTKGSGPALVAMSRERRATS